VCPRAETAKNEKKRFEKQQEEATLQIEQLREEKAVSMDRDEELAKQRILRI
jgi:hypothetical protein